MQATRRCWTFATMRWARCKSIDDYTLDTNHPNQNFDHHSCSDSPIVNGH
jgi:aminopeptidase C